MKIDQKIYNWIRDPEITDFINLNVKKDTNDLALKLSKFNLPSAFILRQIKGMQIAQRKMPFLLEIPEIIYPPHINLEQSSSSETALYKSSLRSGKTVVDLTGGFGIDSMHFSKNFERLIFVEPNEDLMNIVQWNFKKLNINNVEFHTTTAEKFLRENNSIHDLIYIDPSRRDLNKKKVYSLNDSKPNLIELMPMILKNGHEFLFKTSPLLDIEHTINEIPQISGVDVVALDNECKELLFFGSKPIKDVRSINAINIKDERFTSTSCTIDDLKMAALDHSDPKKFLYEPNSAILKAGLQNYVGNSYELLKIASNSHLYTSNQIYENYPGRVFKILKWGDYDLKKLELKKNEKYRIKTRNFRASVDDILKKLKLKEGGHLYLIATTSSQNKPLIIIAESL